MLCNNVTPSFPRVSLVSQCIVLPTFCVIAPLSLCCRLCPSSLWSCLLCVLCGKRQVRFLFRTGGMLDVSFTAHLIRLSNAAFGFEKESRFILVVALPLMSLSSVTSLCCVWIFSVVKMFLQVSWCGFYTFCFVFFNVSHFANLFAGHIWKV